VPVLPLPELPPQAAKAAETANTKNNLETTLTMVYSSFLEAAKLTQITDSRQQPR
jgi:hypothetical protein